METYPLLPLEPSQQDRRQLPVVVKSYDEDDDHHYLATESTALEYSLTTDVVRVSHRRTGYLPKMGFFDNLRGWDKFKIYRYIILLALSLSGDGWYVQYSINVIPT